MRAPRRASARFLASLVPALVAARPFIDIASWRALADPTLDVVGDEKHREAVLARCCQRAVHKQWLLCSPGEASQWLLLQPQKLWWQLLPVDREHQTTRYLSKTLIAPQALALVPRAWITTSRMIGAIQAARFRTSVNVDMSPALG